MADRLDKEGLRVLIAEVLDLPVAEITDEAHFLDDLEVDSLMALEIMVRLEKAYGLRLEESELESITTLAATYDLLDNRLRAVS
ncbi:acyl carrier protein [Actinomadura macra]|uniref:acyl carrier protein n=1 Tax=Actinomadura macra TaxID=46164 RepID=UPI00083252C9|nr:acyl carrier protein [Actinomadura macra]